MEAHSTRPENPPDNYDMVDEYRDDIEDHIKSMNLILEQISKRKWSDWEYKFMLFLDNKQMNNLHSILESGMEHYKEKREDDREVKMTSYLLEIIKKQAHLLVDDICMSCIERQVQEKLILRPYIGSGPSSVLSSVILYEERFGRYLPHDVGTT